MGQNAVSTGTKAGFRMFYPNGNDWWLDPSAGRFDIRMNGGLARATIDGQGNLGIGTTVPLSKLDIVGGANVASANGYALGVTPSNPNGDAFLYFSGAGYFGLNANADLKIFTAGAERLRVTSIGTVGIGSTAPGNYQLKLVGGSAGSLAWGQTEAQQGILSYDPGIAHVLSMSGNSLNFGSNGIISRMVLDTSGDLGIGTTAPAAKLSVNGNSIVGNPIAVPGDLIPGYMLSQFGKAGVVSGHDNVIGGEMNYGFNVYRAASTMNRLGANGTSRIAMQGSQIYMYVGDNGAAGGGVNETLGLMVNPSGCVGIGTTSPAALLSVGSGNSFQVSSSGNLAAINGVSYAWPASQGASGTVLTNNGGALSWGVASGLGTFPRAWLTTSQTWTVPANVLTIYVQCWGGGGGGGGTTSSIAGTGGGGGGYSAALIATTGGTSYNVTIGAAGAGGAGSASGLGGGATTFGNILTAGGGGGGASGNTTYGNGGAGGTASGGTINISGQSGQGWADASYLPGGIGGAAPFGGPGGGGVAYIGATQNGSPGVLPGGGGGGNSYGGGAGGGGSGATGACLISY